MRLSASAGEMGWAELGGGGILFPAFISERCVIGRIPLKLPESRSRAEIENAIQYLAVDKLIKHWHTLEI